MNDYTGHLQTTRKKVTISRVKSSRIFLLDVLREYESDLDEEYRAALSSVRSLLKDIQEDLKERS